MTVLAPGVRLGSYEILTRVGAGGMGEVWKGRDTRLDRLVAIKQLKVTNPERFAREARAVAALNHAGICQIYDVGSDYLVLEFVDGEPLRGPVPIDEVVRLGVQIAAALEAAHRRGILHRDLKPANLLLTRGGGATGELPAIKLVDFGLAKLTADDSGATQTAEGFIAGTPAYMSPEQAGGKALDTRSDVFSFGAVLYELVSGLRAFGGHTLAETISAVLREEPAPLSAPAAVQKIVMRCLKKAPEERFQTITDVKLALERIAPEPAVPQPSIAVLPFANTSGDKENEYFGDGLAEEIITALAQIPGLKVTARTSAFAFKGKEQDIIEIAEVLRVRTVLEGSVRRSGNRVRVTAQLINAADGYQLWSSRYDREMTEAFAIQDEIAQAIVTTLRGHLASDVTPARRYTPRPEAYEMFLKARYQLAQFQPHAISRGRELIERAITLDPEFAMGRQELSSYYLHQALIGDKPAHKMMPLARASALEALACEPDLPGGHALLGVIAGLYDYDWVEQSRRFALALAREPVSPEVRAFHGTFRLLVLGRPVEAAAEMKRALEADPLNLVHRVQLAMSLDAAGEIDEAEAQLRQVLELNERFFPATEWLAIHAAFRGRFDQARGYVERTLEILGQQTRFVGLLAAILEQTGETDRARQLIDTLGSGDRYGACTELMVLHLLRSDPATAAHWAVKAIEQRDTYVVILLPTVVGEALRKGPEWPRISSLLNPGDTLTT